MRDASNNDGTPWLPLEPRFRRGSRAEAIFLAHVRVLARYCRGPLDSEGQLRIDDARRLALESALELRSKDREKLIASLHVATDLVAQGWEIRNVRGTVKVRRPARRGRDAMEEKARVRLQLLAERDAQLRKPSVRRFLDRLERPRIHDGRAVSVFNLMRDGRELAAQLTAAASHDPSNGRNRELAAAIAPYIQVVEGEERCKFTGLRLQEVWRYFRHTWSNPYNTIPGRTMMVLIRDAAAADHPVVGLAALSSPPVQIRGRDEWVGWDSSVFMESVGKTPTRRVASWLMETVDTAIAEIETGDLLRDALLSARELRNPKLESCARLREEAIRARRRHNTLAGGNDYKRALQAKERDWSAISRMQLYRSKRSQRLAEMLEARIVLRRYLGRQPSAAGLRKLLQVGEGRAVVGRVLKKAKADRVGTVVADISVCGAIPPYNPILGGKLVSMLVASPEVVAAYRRRYGGTPSVIASSMAGRPVVRDASLALLTTSSLYSTGASQYNRIKIPGEVFGDDREIPIEYSRVATTGGYGSGQFGPATVRALASFLEQSAGYSRVNSIFGEGVNPRMRKVREALDQLGFPSDELLRHGSQRLIYGVSLVSNLRDFLLGIDSRPKYLFDARRRAADPIAAWWMYRWLSARIERPGVLEEVARHSLVRPVSHGARVPRPEEDTEQLAFPDLQGRWA